MDQRRRLKSLMEKFSRFISQIGETSFAKLQKSKVMVFGIGGVGGYVVEALARSGIQDFVLIDSDVVEESNINRQIIATSDTIGESKVELMKKRILAINKEAKVFAIQKFYLPENSEEFDFSNVNYIIDCVDTVTAKISIICKAKELSIPVISAMGAGNKLDPTQLKVSDIAKTSVDPLAKVMRYELRKRNIKDVKVVYSLEEPIKTGNSTPTSNAFVPSTMGLIIASEVIKDLMK